MGESELDPSALVDGTEEVSGEPEGRPVEEGSYTVAADVGIMVPPEELVSKVGELELEPDPSKLEGAEVMSELTGEPVEGGPFSIVSEVVGTAVSPEEALGPEASVGVPEAELDPSA